MNKREAEDWVRCHAEILAETVAPPMVYVTVRARFRGHWLHATGEAKCNATDTFDAKVGLAIAKTRAMSEIVQQIIQQTTPSLYEMVARVYISQLRNMGRHHIV